MRFVLWLVDGGAINMRLVNSLLLDKAPLDDEVKKAHDVLMVEEDTAMTSAVNAAILKIILLLLVCMKNMG